MSKSLEVVKFHHAILAITKEHKIHLPISLTGLNEFKVSKIITVLLYTVKNSFVVPEIFEAFCWWAPLRLLFPIRNFQYNKMCTIFALL